MGNKKDENWALLGLNGSGKSTLLSMIWYTFATSGEVSVFEKKFGACNLGQRLKKKLVLSVQV